jgi:hypothetical protein
MVAAGGPAGCAGVSANTVTRWVRARFTVPDVWTLN